jgi:dTDP-4-dehydrorhamnose 3,5-epimerase
MTVERVLPPFGISVHRLARIGAEGGDVLHALKASDQGYAGFGEAYFSIVNAGCVKAWRRHHQMTLNLVVPAGAVGVLVASSLRGEPPTSDPLDCQEPSHWGIVLCQEPYLRLTIPPGLWFGMKGLASTQSLLLNISDIPHDPLEYQKVPVDAMPDTWWRRFE